jgi:drug/metabolite transporter (DMT)-like permease
VVLVLAIASAISLGVADYVLGDTLRRDGRTESALTYTAIGSLVGIFVVGVAWPIAPPEAFKAEDALWGLAAGSVIGLALPLLMIGMARGPIAVVTPVIGLVSLVVPAIVGPLLGDQLRGLEVAGLLVALPASAMVAAHPSGLDDGLPVGQALALAATAGALLGAAAIFFGRTSTESGIGPAVVSQIGATGLLLAIAMASPRLVRPNESQQVWLS